MFVPKKINYNPLLRHKIAFKNKKVEDKNKTHSKLKLKESK